MAPEAPTSFHVRLVKVGVHFRMASIRCTSPSFLTTPSLHTGNDVHFGAMTSHSGVMDVHPSIQKLRLAGYVYISIAVSHPEIVCSAS